MASHNEAPAIGIDLGTTFSVAAVHKNTKTEILIGKRGEHLIPSCVLYSLTNLDVNVGEIAESQILRNIENFLYDIKRIIGRKFDDDYIQELIHTKRYRFKIVRGDDDKAEIQLIHNGVLVTKSPEEICSEILKHIRVNATEQIGVEIKEAVISVPARFGNAQRKATRTAAELAGFKVLRLVTEPVAAAIYYAEKAQPNGHLLIVDLGGGTLDISIVKVEDKTFSVKSIEGNTFFGGRDFDFILLNYVKKNLAEKYGITEFSDRFLRRMNKRVVKAKCELSFSENYIEDLSLPRKPCDEELIECEVPISRLEFENLITDLLNEFQTLLNKCLQEAGLTKTDISDAILVGGSTRIPKIRETVRNFLNKEPKTSLNPDEAVALGAAIQAAVLKEDFRSYEKYLFTEITPLFLGFNISFGRFIIAIPKYSKIPFRSQVISTNTNNNQKVVRRNVYEGQRKNCKYNNLLGTFTIKGLPSGKAGDIQLETIFSLDNDGILEVEAWETTNMNRNKLRITISGFGVSDFKAQYEPQQAMLFRKEDDIFHLCAEYKSFVQYVCEHITYDLDKIYEETDKDVVRNTYQNMTSLINQEDLILPVLRTEYVEFYKIMQPLVSKHNIDVVLKPEKQLYEEVSEIIREYNKTFYGPQCTQ